jgi:capsular polysaccharide biosynthesis protein
MELAAILRTLRQHKLALALIFALAVTAALVTGYKVSLNPPKLASRSVPSGQATTQILIDSPQSAIADLKQDAAPLVTRATVFAQLMTSSTIRDRISQATGIPAAQITSEGPFSGPGEAQNVVTPSEARGGQVRAQTHPYRLTFVAQDQIPLVSVYASAPTAALAAKLANGVFIAVNRYVDEIARTDATNPAHRVTVRQLGSAGAATVHSGASKAVMALAFLAVMIFGCLAIIATAAVRQRGAAVDEAVDRFGYAPGHPPTHPSEDVDAPSPALPKIRRAGGWR